MAIAIYARKSSESEDRQVQSLDDQLSVLRRIAKTEGLSITREFVEARSAKDPDTRPEFQRLIKAIRVGKVEGILTWSINRLSRNLVDGGVVAHLLQSGKLQFIRTPEKAYLPEDNALLLAIENGMATSYIQDLRRNVKRGMQGKRDRGWFPHKAVIGYLNNPDTREIDIDPERFFLVQQGWQMILEGGHSVKSAYRMLSAAGLTRRLSGGRSSRLTLPACYSMFANPFYMGKFRHNGELVQGKHPPMITEREFEYAQVLIKGAPDRRLRKHDFQYSGLMRCGTCGCMVVGEQKEKFLKRTGEVKTYVYYHCSGAKGCSKKSVSEATVHQAVDQVFSEISIRCTFISWAKQRCVSECRRGLAGIESGESGLKGQLDLHEKRLQRLHLMRMDGEVEQEQFLSLKSNLEQDIDDCKQRLAVLETAEQRMQEFIERQLSAAEAFSEVQPSTCRRAILKSLGNNHTLTAGSIRINVSPLFREVAALEPTNGSFQSPHGGHSAKTISLWSAAMDRIRKIARDHVLHEILDEQGNLREIPSAFS